MFATSNGVMFMNEEQCRAYCEINHLTYQKLPKTMIFNIVTKQWE